MRDMYLPSISISFSPFNQTFQKKKKRKSFKIYLIPIISILCLTILEKILRTGTEYKMKYKRNINGI